MGTEDRDANENRSIAEAGRQGLRSGLCQSLRNGLRWGRVPVLCAWAVSVLAGCAAGPAPELGRLPEVGAYPQVARGSVMDTYHGTAVADPYRWLEAVDSGETQAFINAQNELTRPFLEKLPQYAAFKQRLTELYTYERVGVPLAAGGRYFFLRHDGKQNQAALYVADTPSQSGRLLLDPNALRSDATVALADFVPSPDGKLLAYALSDAGSDWKTWQLRDVATGQDLTDKLQQTKFTSVSWARDGSGFFYSAYPNGDDQKQAQIRFHRLGTAQSADELIYAVTDHPTRVPYGSVSEDGRFLLIQLDEGTTSNGYLAMSLTQSGRPVTPVFAAFDGIYTFLGTRSVAVGTEAFFRTTAAAPKGQVIAVTLSDSAAGGAGRTEELGFSVSPVRQVVKESASVLEQAALVGDRIWAAYLKDARSQLLHFLASDGKALGEVKLPGLGSISGLTGENGHSETFVSFTDFVTPGQVLRLDAATGVAQLLRSPQVAADVSRYVTEQVFYTSKDGTRVPMFIVRARDFVRNGSAPVLLYGYGGFDVSMTPAFAPSTIAWLEQGGVYAVANLRGGGEYGAEWHLAGTRERKQNVFDDFIAAAEFLVNEHYAAPKRIVIRGGSNGGLLVAAVITQRPELFGAALPDVGVLDMLRYHTASANARMWSDDYGLSENAADFRAQRAYSPLHNTERQSCYPPTLITTAAQDNRVVPWHSFKFAAALQSAQRCKNPVLLRVETRAGHGAGKPQWMAIEHYAEQWAFAAAALEMSP